MLPPLHFFIFYFFIHPQVHGGRVPSQPLARAPRHEQVGSSRNRFRSRPHQWRDPVRKRVVLQYFMVAHAPIPRPQIKQTGVLKKIKSSREREGGRKEGRGGMRGGGVGRFDLNVLEGNASQYAFSLSLPFYMPSLLGSPENGFLQLKPLELSTLKNRLSQLESSPSGVCPDALQDIYIFVFLCVCFRLGGALFFFAVFTYGKNVGGGVMFHIEVGGLLWICFMCVLFCFVWFGSVFLTHYSFLPARYCPTFSYTRVSPHVRSRRPPKMIRTGRDLAAVSYSMLAHYIRSLFFI